MVREKSAMCAWNAHFLRRLGFSYAEIGDLLGIPKGTAYRLCKKPPSYREKRGNKNRLTERPLLSLWGKIAPEVVAKVFYFYVPSWVAERYPKGTIEHSLCYETMLWGLWSYKKLQGIKTEQEFVKAACAYVRRRLFGDFSWASAVKKNAEAHYMTLEEAGFENPNLEEE